MRVFQPRQIRHTRDGMARASSRSPDRPRCFGSTRVKLNLIWNIFMSDNSPRGPSFFHSPPVHSLSSHVRHDPATICLICNNNEMSSSPSFVTRPISADANMSMSCLLPLPGQLRSISARCDGPMQSQGGLHPSLSDDMIVNVMHTIKSTNLIKGSRTTEPPFCTPLSVLAYAVTPSSRVFLSDPLYCLAAFSCVTHLDLYAQALSATNT